MFRNLNRPVAVTAGRLAAGGLSLLTAPILARTLGVEGRGVTATVTASLTVVPLLLSLGLPMGARVLSLTQYDTQTLALAVRRGAILAFVPASAVALVLPDLLIPAADSQVKMTFGAGLLMAPATVVWSCDMNIILARKNYLGFSLLSLCPNFLTALSVVVLAITGALSVASACVSLAASFLASAIASSVVVKPRQGAAPVSLKRLFMASVTFYGAELGRALTYRLDQILIVSIMGAAVGGLYSVSVTITLIPFALSQGLGSYAFNSAGLPETRRGDVAAMLRASAISSSLLVTLLAAPSPWLVQIVFGQEFEGAVLSVMVGLLGAVGVVVGYVACMCLAGQGRGAAMTTCQLVGLFVGIALLFAAAAAGGGASAAAIASAIGYWVTSLSSIAALGVSPRSLVWRMSDLREVRRMLLG